MKLVIQIPCYNEAATLPHALAGLPRAVSGVSEVETLVVDDGSTDGTAEVARSAGADHVVRIPTNRGLAFAWQTGLDSALRSGADLIVNTDGDSQYVGEDVARLVAPILEGRADIVIGARPFGEIEHFSWLKKRLQRAGSRVIGLLCGMRLPDAASGFRAYTREAALVLSVGPAHYTHTLDSLIRAARRGMRVVSVPVRVNGKLRESRLFGNTPQYIWRQAITVLRVLTMVRPLRVFGWTAAAVLTLGLAGCARFMVFYFSGHGSGHVQSLLLSAMLVTVGFVVGMIGLSADMTAANRQLIEECLCRLRRFEIDAAAASQGVAASRGQPHGDEPPGTVRPAGRRSAEDSGTRRPA